MGLTGGGVSVAAAMGPYGLPQMDGTINPHFCTTHGLLDLPVCGEGCCGRGTLFVGDELGRVEVGREVREKVIVTRQTLPHSSFPTVTAWRFPRPQWRIVSQK